MLIMGRIDLKRRRDDEKSFTFRGFYTDGI